MKVEKWGQQWEEERKQNVKSEKENEMKGD